jgi:hypothetical protein
VIHCRFLCILEHRAFVSSPHAHVSPHYPN